MKKSTIFLIILVYIVSFVIVGLFGIQARGYNEIIYVESITLRAVDEELVQSKYKPESQSYTFMTYYEDNLVVKFKAEVLPANATNKKVKLSYDTEIATFDEPDEDGFFNASISNDGYGAIEFDVVSTDGKDFKIHAKLMIL